MEYRLAIIGFGNVGQGFAEILRDHGPRLLEQFGVRYRIVGVSDNLKGSIHDPAGFDPGDLLDAVRLSGNLGGVEAPDRGWDGVEMARQSSADAVVEPPVDQGVERQVILCFDMHDLPVRLHVWTTTGLISQGICCSHALNPVDRCRWQTYQPYRQAAPVCLCPGIMLLERFSLAVVNFFRFRNPCFQEYKKSF